MLMVNLAAEAKKEKFKLDQMLNSARTSNDDNLPAQTFVALLKQYFLDFVKANRLESSEVIERLVLYLQDKKPGYLSYKRLRMSLQRQKNEKPLRQLGIEQQEKYVADIKEKLEKAKDEDEVRALAEYMIERGKGV
jgi:hypothetical protein